MLGLSLFSSGGLPGTHWCPINLPKHTSFYLLLCLYSHAFGELSIRIIRSHLTHQILTTSKARRSGVPSTCGRDKEWFCYVDHPSILEVSVRSTHASLSSSFYISMHIYEYTRKVFHRLLASLLKDNVTFLFLFDSHSSGLLVLLCHGWWCFITLSCRNLLKGYQLQLR